MMSDPSAQSHTNESRRVVSEVEGLRAELKARDREIQTWKDTVRERTYELSQAKKEAAELRERAENAESMNVSISVCANHTAEIVSTEVSCWVCEAYEANERAEKAEAEIAKWSTSMDMCCETLDAKTQECRHYAERAERAESVADYWCDAYTEAKEEAQQYAFLFELADKRTGEATAAWREATGRHNVSPDLGMLLEWLLNRIDELEANLAMAEYDDWELADWCKEATEERDEAIAKAEKLAKALRRVADIGSHEPDCNVCGYALDMRFTAQTALAAYRESQNADTSLQVTTDRDTKTCSDLCQALIQAIEIDHDYGCECEACRAIAEHRKVAPEATITQEET